MTSRIADRRLERALDTVREALPAITGLSVGDGRALGKYYGAYISSTFQPWRNPAGGSIVAVEAYARSHSKNGSDLSPWQLFAGSAVDSDLVTLDRLCRTVHALNYFNRPGHGFAVAVNADSVIHARSLAHLLVPDVLMVYASAFSPDALARQVESLHEAGVRVGVKLVETAETFAAAEAAGVDWVQGFHLDRPSPDLFSFAIDRS